MVGFCIVRQEINKEWVNAWNNTDLREIYSSLFVRTE